MENIHETFNESSIDDSLKIKTKKIRINDRTIERSKGIMAAIIEEADASPIRRTPTAEAVVQANIEGIKYLRDKGYSVERIYQLFTKRIRLGIGPASFARYVRRNMGTTSGTDSAPALPMTNPAQAAEPAPVTGPDWNCPYCKSSSVPEDCHGENIWGCEECGATYASGPDGKISTKRFVE